MQLRALRVREGCEAARYLVGPAGPFPNNSEQPVQVYKDVFGTQANEAKGAEEQAEGLAVAFEELFSAHGWGNGWRDIVYPYPHFHSTAYEVLGVYVGTDSVQLGGGEEGEEGALVVDLQPGDVLLLPPGVAHKSLRPSPDFLCVGAYPIGGQEVDLLYGRPEELAQALLNIRAVPCFASDPVLGLLQK